MKILDIKTKWYVVFMKNIHKCKFVCKFFKTDDIIRYVMNFDSELNSEEIDILVKKAAISVFI